MTLSEIISLSLTTSAIGMGVTFCALIFLMYAVKLLGKIIGKN